MDDETTLSKGEQTRQAILAAAKGLFMRQGYAATTMRQISQAVGITAASIYNHFAGKEEIFDTLLRQAAPMEELFRLLDVLEGDTTETVVRRLFRGVLDLFATHGDYIALSLIDAQERDGATLVKFIPLMSARFMALHDKLAALDAGRGELRALPPYVFPRILISLVAGYLITEHVGKPQATLNLPETDWAGVLADVFMRGVMKGENADAHG
jgi:AcrR family transcriptional regulator